MQQRQPPGGLRRLDDSRYMAAHVLFRSRSTQRRELYGWLRDKVIGHRRGRADLYSILSVGSGTGALDAALVADLQVVGPVGFVGVDPNGLENEECRARLSRAVRSGSTARVVESRIESFDAAGVTFDAVLAVHAFYYSPDPDLMLRRAIAPLARGGAAFFLSAPSSSPLSQLFVETSRELHGFAPCLSDEMGVALRRLGFRVRVERIPAVLDVTVLRTPDDPEGELLLDFIVHADTRGAARSARERYRHRVLEMSSEVAGCHLVPHPVDGVTAVR